MTEIPNDLGGHPVLAMDETYHQTLKWINRIRRKYGKGGLRKIRKGNHTGYHCPIASSLKDCFDKPIYASRYNVFVMDSIEEEKYPKYVIEFVRAFDARKKYLELYKWE